MTRIELYRDQIRLNDAKAARLAAASSYLGFTLCEQGVEEADYHANGWYTNFPPSVPASTKQTQTLESMIEQLKADGVKERPKQDWQRRKAASR